MYLINISCSVKLQYTDVQNTNIKLFCFAFFLWGILFFTTHIRCFFVKVVLFKSFLYFYIIFKIFCSICFTYEVSWANSISRRTYVTRRENHYCVLSAWNISEDTSHTSLAFWISLHRQTRDFSSLTSVRCWWSHVPFKWEMHTPLHAIFSAALNQNTFINIHLACLPCMLTLFILASLYSQCTCSTAGERTKEALWWNAWANC